MFLVIQRIALGLGCLVCTGQGRRVQKPSEPSQPSPPLESNEFSTSSRQSQASGMVNASIALVNLLSALDVATAFQPSARGVQPLNGRPSTAASQPALLHGQSRASHPVAQRRSYRQAPEDYSKYFGSPIDKMSKGALAEVATMALGIPTGEALEMDVSDLRRALKNYQGGTEIPEQNWDLINEGVQKKTIDVDKLPGKDNFWGLPEGLAISLGHSGIVELNDMQRAALDVALKGKNVILHGETGCGKTLCYVLPILAKHSWHDEGLQAIVITPTLELAAQVAHVFNLLRPESAEAMTMDTEELPDVPIFVAPPKMLLRWVEGGGERPRLPLEKLRTVRSIVIDEADALLKPLGIYSPLKRERCRARHPPATEMVLGHMHALNPNLQVYAASATVGRPLRRLIRTICSQVEFEVIRGNANGMICQDDDTPGPTKRVLGLPENVSVGVVTSAHENLLTAVHHVLREEEPKKPLLFIPPGRSLLAELEFLRNSGLDAVSINDKIRERAANANDKLAAPANSVDEGQLLVSTQGECRGLDMPGIDLVVMLGTPPTTEAFLHMAGRTGRQGAEGRVVIVTTRKDADAKLIQIGSHLDVDFGLDRTHLEETDEDLMDMWQYQAKRYNEDKPEQFFLQMERPKGKDLKKIQEEQAEAARKAAILKTKVLGAKLFSKKSLSRKARKRVNRKKREAQAKVNALIGGV